MADRIPFVDLQRGHQALGGALEARVIEVVRSGRYVLGPQVERLEQAMADYLGVDHAIAVGSGSDALRLSLVALDIGVGDEVITTPFTFAATLEAIVHTGATPVLVDIDPDTYNLDPRAVAAAVTTNTRAILPVHLFGLPADMGRICALASRRGLAVVEDCAQSLGARIDGRPVGSFGDAAAFSFYPTKILGGIGDGGLIATGDARLARRLRRLRNHGDDGAGGYDMAGFNSRLDEIQAAVLTLKLDHLDARVARRRRIAARYNQQLLATGAQLPTAGAGVTHAYGYYTLSVAKRDRLREQLGNAGIGSALYYASPLHLHPRLAATSRFGALPRTEAAAARCLSLPIFPELSDAEVDYVALSAARCLTQGA